jgi:hypothetical protein
MPNVQSSIERPNQIAAIPDAASVELDRLIWVAPLTIVASVAAVLIGRGLAIWILRPPPTFSPLGIAAPVGFTTVLVLASIVVFVMVACFADHPVRRYRWIAVIALLVSFVPCVTLAGQSGKVPGAGWPAAIALMLMHVTAWYVTVTMLTRLCAGRSVKFSRPEF